MQGTFAPPRSSGGPGYAPAFSQSVHDLFIRLRTSRAALGTPLSVKNYLYKAPCSILFCKPAARARFTKMTGTDPLRLGVSFNQMVKRNASTTTTASPTPWVAS